MKAIITLLAGMSAAVLYSSCSDYSSTYYESGNGTHGYSTAHVSIIRTSNSCWGYDPYRRAYYDYRCKRYYDYNRGCYHTKIPYRYSSAVYPTSYRSGRAISCPQRLTKVSYYGHSTHKHSSYQQPSHGQERHKRGSNYPLSRSAPNRSTSSSDRYYGGRTSTTTTRQPSRSESATHTAQPVRIHKVPSTQQTTRPTLPRVQTVRTQPKIRPQTTRPAPTRTQTRQPSPRVQRSQPAPQPSVSPRQGSNKRSGNASRSQRR